MKIGIVLATTPGYSETFFRSKIRGLHEAGYEVTLFTQTREANFDACRVIVAPRVYSNRILQIVSMVLVYLSMILVLGRLFRYVQLERGEGKSMGSALKSLYLNSHILKRSMNWLHFGFATQAVGREVVAKAIGASMSVSFRGFDINVYPLKHKNVYKSLWKHVDKVHSISQYLLHRAYELGLAKETPYAIITPAVDLESLPSNELKPNKTPYRFTTIARLHWIKGIDTALQAMALLKEKGIQFEYHIIGDGLQKDAERYKYLMVQLNLQHEVCFHGKLSHSNTLNYLKETTIYIQPSLNEGFCNAVLEAQAMGVLCIASNAGGLSENIEDGKTGWLFETGNKIDLVQKIENCLSMNKEEQYTVRQHAIQRVKEQFDIESQKEQFVKFYN